MVHENLTLFKTIQYNTDFKDVPENVMFASQLCAGVRNHQCILKPEKPTCPTPTDTPSAAAATTTASSAETNKTITDKSTTQATTAATTTTVTVTKSPCCFQRDICNLKSANLSQLVDVLRRNQTTLKADVSQLEMDLHDEKVINVIC